MPDFLISTKATAGGNAAVKTIFFILISIVLLFIVFTYQSDKNQIFNEVEKVKIGMTRAQVLEIMGSPKRNERSPFTEELSLSKELQVNKTDDKSFHAVQRDRYELYWFTSSNRADIWDFDVYYDAQSKVCFLNRWRTSGRVLIEY